MKLTDVKAVIPRKGMRTLENLPGPLVDGYETRENVTELIVHLNGEDCPAVIETLFPGSDAMAKAVAAQDGGKGYAIASNVKSSPLSVSLRHAKDSAVLMASCDVTVAKLKVRKVKDDGERWLVLKVLARLTETQTIIVAQLIGADIVVGIEPAQLDLPTTEVTEPAPTTAKRGRGKKGKGAASEPTTDGADIEMITVQGKPMAVTIEALAGSDGVRWRVAGFDGCEGVAPGGRADAVEAAREAVKAAVRQGIDAQ